MIYAKLCFFYRFVGYFFIRPRDWSRLAVEGGVWPIRRDVAQSMSVQFPCHPWSHVRYSLNSLMFYCTPYPLVVEDKVNTGTCPGGGGQG